MSLLITVGVLLALGKGKVLFLHLEHLEALQEFVFS